MDTIVYDLELRNTGLEEDKRVVLIVSVAVAAIAAVLSLYLAIRYLPDILEGRVSNSHEILYFAAWAWSAGIFLLAIPSAFSSAPGPLRVSLTDANLEFEFPRGRRSVLAWNDAKFDLLLRERPEAPHAGVRIFYRRVRTTLPGDAVNAILSQAEMHRLRIEKYQGWALVPAMRPNFTRVRASQGNLPAH